MSAHNLSDNIPGYSYAQILFPNTAPNEKVSNLSTYLFGRLDYFLSWPTVHCYPRLIQRKLAIHRRLSHHQRCEWILRTDDNQPMPTDSVTPSADTPVDKVSSLANPGRGNFVLRFVRNRRVLPFTDCRSTTITWFASLAGRARKSLPVTRSAN